MSSKIGLLYETILYMNIFGERLDLALKTRKVTPARLARAIGISRQSIGHLLSGMSKSMSAQNCALTASYLGVSSKWLATGEGDMNDIQGVGTTDSSSTIPLLSWSQAAEWKDFVWDKSTPKVPRPHHANQCTFALRMEGDYMEPRLLPGMLLAIDPTQQATLGRFVLAKGISSPVLQQIATDGSELFLKPLNTRYPIRPLTKDITIIGILVWAGWLDEDLQK